ncbi:hypothetical protein M758_UG033200 [Ceratodon purpureus]|nr:hypothetical protein M758_UG033200 [Ceratodon purpureus]
MIWKAMLLHQPELKKLNKKFGDLLHHVFLMLKLKIKKNDIVWFQPRPVGKNTLCHMVKNLIESTLGIDIAGCKFSNKTPHRMDITWMEEVHILSEKGMAVTGHRDVKSYKQYNAKTDSTDMQAFQRIISGISTICGDGKVLKFSEVLTEERKVDLKKGSLCSILCSMYN